MVIRIPSFSRQSARFRIIQTMIGGLLAFALTGHLRAADPVIRENINWPDFLARHDLVWDLMPTNINNAPIIGNGAMSASIHKDGSSALSWEVYRIDVTDHRIPVGKLPHPLYDTPRLAIGRFDLKTVGAVQSTAMRVNLWDATCTGTLTTTRGTVSWRSFVPYDTDLIIVEFTTTGDESGFNWTWVPFSSSATRYLGKMEGIKRMTPEQLKARTPDPDIDNYKLNPDVQVKELGDLIVSKHSLLAGGHFAVACRVEKPSAEKRIYRISIQPVSDHATDDAMKAVRANQPIADLFAKHTAWWHAFYPASFLSIPDTRLEGHYWIQNYKLASLTRPGGPPIDVYGYGLADSYAGWPNIWWNMNVQENYYGCFTGNHLALGESLSGSLERFADNLSKNVPVPEWQKDSAWIGRVSDQQLRTEVKFTADGSPDWANMELSDLTWAMELYHRQCRYAADDVRLRTKFLPLLEKCVNFYRHLLVNGPDGKLHTPKATSPEIGSDSDLNYDLGALRWALGTLIDECTRLGISPPQMQTWRDLQKNLVDFPVGEHGLKIGAHMELTHSHRHYSHLLAFYPLYALDWDNPDQRDLIKKSVDHWWDLFTDPIMKRENFFGYSQTGGASMFASMGDGDRALAALHGYLDYNATFNAFYREGTIEIPFSVSQSTHEMLLQSRKGLIRIFPAMPSTWKDTVFENLRTEGAFLISGRWRDGRADWVRVQSLAGEPCRVRVHFDGPVKTTGATPPRPLGTDTYELSLKKGEDIVLYSAAQTPDLTVQPLEGDPSQRNCFGYTKAMQEKKLRATVKLAPEFKNNMTLPASVPVPIEGTAAPGSLVIVQLDGRGKKTNADATGHWQVTLAPLKATDRTLKLEVIGEEGDTSIRISRIGSAH
ncbi:MAG TPA: hypothetical protein VL357_10240 [Rariglobus sp.]|nr:hypothetical protein [Rariglobus sp.]